MTVSRIYIDLHMKIERSLPKLPKEATPQQIDRNQRTFESLMRTARATAKPGTSLLLKRVLLSSGCWLRFLKAPKGRS